MGSVTPRNDMYWTGILRDIDAKFPLKSDDESWIYYVINPGYFEEISMMENDSSEGLRVPLTFSGNILSESSSRTILDILKIDPNICPGWIPLFEIYMAHYIMDE